MTPEESAIRNRDLAWSQNSALVTEDIAQVVADRRWLLGALDQLRDVDALAKAIYGCHGIPSCPAHDWHVVHATSILRMLTRG